jgi:hypothetical protein
MASSAKEIEPRPLGMFVPEPYLRELKIILWSKRSVSSYFSGARDLILESLRGEEDLSRLRLDLSSASLFRIFKYPV